MNKRAGIKRLSLALQGGGSHGAFTWGALDRLLEEERIDLDGLSGASAGAINAALVAHGMVQGGRAGAREALRDFWENVMSALPAPVETLVALTRFLSPHQLNPLQLNPLRELLVEHVDFEAVRRSSTLRLFVCATEIASGMPRIFGTRELTLEVLLASSCLPPLHAPVTIDGVAYWDGGLTANPPVRPLVYQCDASDILLVLLQPERSSIPESAAAIWARVSEISFSANVFSELQGIALAKQEAERRLLSLGALERRLRRLKLHAIGPTASVGAMDSVSRLKTDPPLLTALYREGYAQAHAWLQRNFDDLGVRSTLALTPHLRQAMA